MAHVTCQHNWCDGCCTGSIPNDTHESLAVSVAGVDGITVSAMVSYVDGDREPLIFIGGGETDLNLAGLDNLIAVLQEKREIMRAVQPTPVRVAA
jgi:hypothetical protein